jgi:hypothetical protein
MTKIDEPSCLSRVLQRVRLIDLDPDATCHDMAEELVSVVMVLRLPKTIDFVFSFGDIGLSAADISEPRARELRS